GTACQLPNLFLDASNRTHYWRFRRHSTCDWDLRRVGNLDWNVIPMDVARWVPMMFAVVYLCCKLGQPVKASLPSFGRTRPGSCFVSSQSLPLCSPGFRCYTPVKYVLGSFAAGSAELCGEVLCHSSSACATPEPQCNVGMEWKMSRLNSCE